MGSALLFSSFMGILSFFMGQNQITAFTPADVQGKTLYDQTFILKDLRGNSIDYHAFKGKKVLIVNTASKCGFTGQYEGLEELYKSHQDRLIILGVPCNQFMNQEPGTSENIISFCQANYGISFPMTEKMNVKSEGQCDLYRWLTHKSENGVGNFSIKWNFNKFLLNEQGVITHYFGSETKPLDSILLQAIED